ncbi:hypothetical protein ABZ312_09535 [Streptomyces sp. NPDC006207]
MPVEPVPCAPGGGSTPVEVTTCCAPSIASAALCRADGSTVLLVVRSGCVECGEAAPDPEVVGWIDAATGTFTAGPPPADAGPCESGCADIVPRDLCDDTDGDGQADTEYSELWCVRADGTAELLLTYQGDPSTPYVPVSPVPCAGECIDTVCRQRCDDTDGDGQADATYSELWCIHEDGSAELVLTYQDDPSVPYVPTAPVDCTYGCPESETVTLCDDTGPFLRRYSFLNGTATYEDVALDGQTPHVVTGTVGVCETDTSSDCVDTVCRQRCDDTDGDGQPDATYSELWCVHADGTAELVLTYQDDPSVPYTPVAPVDCEYANETTEVLTLCDDTGPFLRRYSWLGDTASFEDVELDGVTPHVVTGTPGVCAAQAECEAATTPAATLGLCLADGTPIAVIVTRDCAGTVTQDGWLNLTTGAYSAGAPPAGAQACGDSRAFELAGLLCDVDPATGDVLGLVLVEYQYNPDGSLSSVRLVDPATGTTYTLQGELRICPGGAASNAADQDLTVLCDVRPDGSSVPFVRDFRRDPITGAVTGHTDYGLDGAPYTVTGTVGVCPASADEPGVDVELLPMCVVDNASGGIIQRILAEVRYDTESGDRLSVNYVDPLTWGPVAMPGGTHLDVCPEEQPEPSPDVAVIPLCDVVGGADPVPFLRHLVYLPGAATPTVLDTGLDGVTPYAPAGTVGTCSTPAEDCRDSSTLLLCDLPTDGDPAPTVTDTPGGPYYPYTTGVAMPGAQTLWDGGTLVFPDAAGPQPGTGGTVRTAAAVIQAPRPVCDAGTARVTVQVDVTQLGPDNGCRNSGFLGLYNGPGDTNRVALALAPLDTPAGWSGTLTAEADVPAADLAAGNIVALVAFDAYDDSGATCPPPRRTAWQLSAFTATTAYDQTGCDTQFLRTVTVDCETGAVTAVADTTLDGQPYTLTGEPGQCTPTGSGGTVVEPCGDTEVVQLCDLTYDPQAPIPTPAGDFTLTGNVVAANNGTTLWFAQANQPADGVAELLVSGLLPATLYEFRFASAWVGAGGSDPVGNAAIYRLDVLDGATVLATRTRNVSNGSNVFPGGVLSEDMPPLAFIAPATGAVTIRFTDQTTGGPINDRDLFLTPLEVRTAVLTVTRTPFLRRFTFDCDGGLTSTQDLGLDGTTPYVVEGEASNCAGDGTAAGSVTPCDVQNVLERCRCDDTDGDGLADTEYLDLLGVDCDGQLTSLGTYLPDLSAPYTPVAPVDCEQVDEGADPAVGVQAHRIELSSGASWDATAVVALQSVTAVAHGGTGTITTSDGASTLHTGEAATWSVARAEDAALTGPLTITADSGTVTVTWTQGVTLS